MSNILDQPLLTNILEKLMVFIPWLEFQLSKSSKKLHFRFKYLPYIIRYILRYIIYIWKIRKITNLIRKLQII